MFQMRHNRIGTDALSQVPVDTVNSMETAKQPTSSNTIYDPNVLQRPHSLVWRFFHGLHYLIGGVTFIIGSVMYFPKVYGDNSQALNVGASMFIVGSFYFLLADLQEWWYYRVGCVCYGRYRAALEYHSEALFVLPSNTIFGWYQRAEAGINCVVSIIGSLLYLVGSILFLPSLQDQLIVGEWLFIIGSAFIFVSQAWKVYRVGCTNPSDRLIRLFRFANLFNNLPALFADIFGGFGGLFYFIGTILFFPDLSVSDTEILRAPILFVFGGVSFTLGGIFLNYYYYCAGHK